MRIPLTRPFVDDAEVDGVAEVLRSGWLTQGPKTHEFEGLVADYVGAPHAVATSSATTALQVALLLADIGPGDEVIVPSLSFVATANVVRHVGATPIFVDVRPDTYNLDERLLEQVCSPQTRAIMPVDQLGVPAEWDAITAFAAERHLTVIEDAACAFGSAYHGRKVGSLVDLTCFSFHPRKVITTGEGGMLVTTSDRLAARARSLISHGEAGSDLARHASTQLLPEEYDEAGFNFRMTNMQGAIGVAQMAKLESLIARRAELAARYCTAFAESPCIEPPRTPAGVRVNWQSFMVRILPGSPVGRDELAERLRSDGVQARPGIHAIHQQRPYRELPLRAPLPETERAVRTTLILPLYPQMREDEQDFVIERVLHHVSR